MDLKKTGAQAGTEFGAGGKMAYKKIKKNAQAGVEFPAHASALQTKAHSPRAQAGAEFHGPAGASRAQAGVEFIMTYSWALLLLVIALAVLWQLGVFNVGSYVSQGDQVIGFNTFEIPRFALRGDGSFTLNLHNSLDRNVTVKSVSIAGVPVSNPSPVFNFNVGAGKNQTLSGTSGTTGTPGTAYDVIISITYDVEGGAQEHVDAGRIRSYYVPV